MYTEIAPEPFVVYRSIGPHGGERYGFGVMDKSGSSCDYCKRAHNSYVIVLLLRGCGVYRDEHGNEYPLGPGSIFQRFAGVPHTTMIDPSSRWLECFVEIGDAMASMLERYGSADRSMPVLTTTATTALAERFCSLGKAFREEGDSELLVRLPEILDLALYCLRDESASGRDADRRRIVEHACNHLGKDFDQPDRLDEFCRKYGLGYENFRKIFKQATGMSPHRYRVRRRLDAACALLARKELSIAEISLRLGYSSPYEFSAQFRRQIGVPPSGYRPR